MTCNTILSIQWPAVLKLEGDAELMLLTQDDADDLFELITTSKDQLVDSSGNLFRVAISDTGKPILVRTAGILSLDELIDWLRAHASQQSSCCVSKLGASNYSDAMKLAIAIIED